MAQTAAESQPSAPPSPRSSGGTLGRYKLERELGAGGMGVVHAAFDPELERRVALKVLRGNTTDEARQRLLREARAMARLNHPNVVVVHEVGSIGGRDYVAMEMVEGGTLEQWLRGKARSQHDIIAAYLAAGRGLAAAHAAGLVHRDFKPHNVLRDASGRIAVTDFGLVVGIAGSSTTSGSSLPPANISLDATLPPGSSGDGALDATVGPSATTGKTPSSLAGLTETGAVMGTPAYMAPEQWLGANVGPAADQFSFCVALWEALAGERPYRGTTIEELQKALDRGPTRLDETKVPRRLRKILKRGLESEAAKRWPSMDALLAAIGAAERRPRVLAAFGGAAVIAGVIVALAVTRGGEARGCDRPVLDPSSIALPAGRYESKLLAAHLAAWRAARERVCKVEPAARAPKIACLDGALVRIDLMSRALAAPGLTGRVDIKDSLLDPTTCERGTSPRLVRAASPELLAVTTEHLRAVGSNAFGKPAAEKLIAAAGSDSCAMATARLAAASIRADWESRKADLVEAESQAQRCNDDLLVATAAVEAFQWAMWNFAPDLEIQAQRKRAEAALALVPQLAAEMEGAYAEAAKRAQDFDEAIRRGERAAMFYRERGELPSEIAASLAALENRRVRATPEDLASIEPSLMKLRARAQSELPAGDAMTNAVERQLANWMFLRGDVAGMYAKFAAIHRPVPAFDPAHVRGRVVDTAGKGVEGATVSVGTVVLGTSSTAALPQGDLLTVQTGPDGSFELDAAPRSAAIIAERGDQRSHASVATDGMTLTLQPTSQLSGTVDLRGHPPTQVLLMVRDVSGPTVVGYYGISAPVAPDGSFVISGVPRGRIIVQSLLTSVTGIVAAGQDLVVSEPVVVGLRILVADSSRTVQVIVRGTTAMPLGNPQAFVLPGKVASTTFETFMTKAANVNLQMTHAIDDRVPPAVKDKAKPGDRVATFNGVPAGQLSACVVGFPSNSMDSVVLQQLTDVRNQRRVPIPCVQMGPTDEVVVVEVPPWPRFD